MGFYNKIVANFAAEHPNQYLKFDEIYGSANRDFLIRKELWFNIFHFLCFAANILYMTFKVYIFVSKNSK